MLVGDTSDYGNLLQLVLNAIPLPANPEALILPAGSGDKPVMGIDSLPDSAQICSCFDVSKGDIIKAEKGGCHTFAALKSETWHRLRLLSLQTHVASLLASCWNEYVLAPQHTSLQDSNDLFLGNIQKDGTYSVIPRSPGGEITPQGLEGDSNATVSTPKLPVRSASACSTRRKTICPLSGRS
nr:nitrite reductase large subunit [Candidatus Pantoea persica]